jgi:hypothetical protein
MPTKTAISAYSIEVAPDWSVANCLSRFTMDIVHCWRLQTVLDR